MMRGVQVGEGVWRTRLPVLSLRQKAGKVVLPGTIAPRRLK